MKILIHGFKKYLSLLSQIDLKAPAYAPKSGYGLALLMVFLSSSVLLATSMSLILTPSVASYITNQSTTPIVGAQAQIVNAALDAAKNDILTNYLGQGITVDTSYRYPATGSNSITTPTYPGSGATNTIGSYYVTVTKVRGFTYILQATVTVNGMTKIVSRLFQLSASPKCIIKNAYFAYSLRKICSSYNGKAVQVRRSSDNATQDIGFVGNDFDVASFRTFLGKDLPLNINSTATAAYSLRKLSTSYSGKAINVRRSSDNATQDIGFNSFGNLDTKSLLSFIGTGSGYIATWYDQSGNGRNVTQATSSQQPRIVNAGLLETANSVPAVHFIGSSSTALSTTSVPLPAGQNQYTYFGVVQVVTPSASDQVLFEQNASTCTASKRSALSSNHVGTYGFIGQSNNWYTGVTTPVNQLFQTSMTVDNTLASNNITIYKDGGSGISGTTNGGPSNLNIGANKFALGYSSCASTEYLEGYISEVIVYSSLLTTANRTAIQNNQGQYYKSSALQDGFVTTWYDQSGNGINLTQATTTAQPIIDLSGSAPGLFFDARLCQTNGSSTCEYLGNSSLNQTLSPMTMTALGVGQITANSATSWSGRMLSIYKTGTSDDSNASSALILNYYSTNPITLGSKKDSSSALSVSNTWGQDFQATSIADGTNRSFRAYQTSTGLVTGTTTSMASESLVMNNIQVGINNGLNNNAFWDGRINELLFYTTALPSSTYQTYESNQRAYYGL